MNKVTLEEVKRVDGSRFFVVKNDAGFIDTFPFKEDEADTSAWNKARALSDAKALALILRDGVSETRTLIEF